MRIVATIPKISFNLIFFILFIFCWQYKHKLAKGVKKHFVGRDWSILFFYFFVFILQWGLQNFLSGGQFNKKIKKFNYVFGGSKKIFVGGPKYIFFFNYTCKEHKSILHTGQTFASYFWQNLLEAVAVDCIASGTKYDEFR